jgi:hypothetical protein
MRVGGRAISDLVQQFGQAVGGAGCLREFAPDFRQAPSDAGGNDRIEQELAERAGRERAFEHIVGADPKHGDDAAEDQGDGKAGQQRARADGGAGGAHRRFRRSAVAAGGCGFAAEGLNGAGGRYGLVGEGGGVGKRILRGARAPAHRAAEGDQRKDDQRDGASTRLDSLGEVTTIMPMAPRHRIMLRSATDAVAPTADLICVVSAVSRETISPDWLTSKKEGESRVTWAKTSRRRSETMRSPSVMTK